MISMTGCTPNSNNGNNNGTQQRVRPYNSRKQIACRLCNRVYVNTQALITHIESHILEEEMMALRRQNQQLQINQTNSLINPSQRNLFAPIPFRPSSSLLSRETGPPPVLPVLQHPSAVAAPRRNNPSVPSSGGPSIVQHYNIINNNNFSRQPNTPAQVSPSAKSVGKRQRTGEEELDPNDCTRPFLSQLDRPIPKPVTKPEDLEKEKGVDLTLRLWPKTP